MVSETSERDVLMMMTMMMEMTTRVCATSTKWVPSSIMAAEPVVQEPWGLRCWEAVSEEETAKIDEMLEANLAHDDQRSAATTVPSDSGEPEQRSFTSVAMARGSLARRRVE